MTSTTEWAAHAYQKQPVDMPQQVIAILGVSGEEMARHRHRVSAAKNADEHAPGRA